MSRPQIYLAGPDVFHADAADIGRRKKAICARFGLEGLFPVDTETDAPGDEAAAQTAQRIYRTNIALLERADAVIANVTPFLGALADDGTSFEIGYAVARGAPVVLYDNGAGDTASKARALLAAAPTLRDPTITPEDFGLPVNLMLAVAARDVVGGASAVDMGALERFEEAARRMAAILAGPA